MTVSTRASAMYNELSCSLGITAQDAIEKYSFNIFSYLCHSMKIFREQNSEVWYATICDVCMEIEMEIRCERIGLKTFFRSEGCMKHMHVITSTFTNQQ